ncbi:MAG: phosphotransferase, partial [Nocardioidaceae bacterium]
DVSAPALEDPRLRWYRGGRLSDLDDDFRAAVEAGARLPGLDLDLRRAVDVWERALDAEPSVAPPARWYHGDLLAENLLVRDGRLTAVLDLGGLAVGDPTVDLVVAWEVLDADGREVFRRALDVDETTWARGAGWALLIAMITFPYYWESLPSRCAARRAMAAAVLERGAG